MVVKISLFMIFELIYQIPHVILYFVGERTFGVVTKLDLMDAGTNCLDVWFLSSHEFSRSVGDYIKIKTFMWYNDRSLREDPTGFNIHGLELWIDHKLILTRMLIWWLLEERSKNILKLALIMDTWHLRWAQYILQNFYQRCLFPP